VSSAFYEDQLKCRVTIKEQAPRHMGTPPRAPDHAQVLWPGTVEGWTMDQVTGYFPGWE